MRASDIFTAAPTGSRVVASVAATLKENTIHLKSKLVARVTIIASLKGSPTRDLMHCDYKSFKLSFNLLTGATYKLWFGWEG